MPARSRDVEAGRVCADWRSRPRRARAAVPRRWRRRIAPRLLPRPEISTTSRGGLTCFPQIPAFRCQRSPVTHDRVTARALLSGGGSAMPRLRRTPPRCALLSRLQPQRAPGADLLTPARLSGLSRRYCRRGSSGSRSAWSRSACSRTTGTWCSSRRERSDAPVHALGNHYPCGAVAPTSGVERAGPRLSRTLPLDADRWHRRTSMRVCRYVERNALQAGLVRRAQDWPWCSLAERLRPQPRGVAQAGAVPDVAAWIDT